VGGKIRDFEVSILGRRGGPSEGEDRNRLHGDVCRRSSDGRHDGRGESARRGTYGHFLHLQLRGRAALFPDTLREIRLPSSAGRTFRSPSSVMR
jgi:hypothetical protein